MDSCFVLGMTGALALTYRSSGLPGMFRITRRLQFIGTQITEMGVYTLPQI